MFLGRPWPASGEPLFEQDDTAWALALHELEAQEAAAKCPLCGLPMAVCRAIENQNRFKVSAERCHATNAILQRQAVQGGDDVSQRATAWSARLPD